MNVRKAFFVFVILSLAVLMVNFASAMNYMNNPMNQQAYAPVQTNYQVSYQPLSESFTPTYNVKVTTLASNYYYPPSYVNYMTQNTMVNVNYAPMYSYNFYSNPVQVHSYPIQPYTTTRIHYFSMW